MKALRAKIALLFVLTNIVVVVFITVSMILTLNTPQNTAAMLMSNHFIMIHKLASNLDSSSVLHEQPDSGIIDEDQTKLLRSSTEKLGNPLDIAVTYHATDRRIRTASIRVGPRGWLVMDYDPPSDPEWWGWLILVTIGIGLVSVLLANRMSKPLALLESAVESVDLDGVMPALAEQGPTEVRATAAAINSLSARLKRAMESRMRLVAAAGHDLRTPLTRMRLRAEFVTDEEERALWLKDINELGQIADSAMELVREETTRDSPEVIKVDDLVKGIVAELQEQGFAVEVIDTTSTCVKANRLALSRALRNLFINAATHGVRGTVSVSGGVTAQITISDQGPGIDPGIINQVFEPFFRADRARNQKFPGAGLGLSISKEIIGREGGNISIANGATGGLTQIVELPAVG